MLRRPDALDPANVDVLRDAAFVYLVGESPMHVRSVLKDTPAWDAIVAAWDGGAVLAGSVAGAMVCCDPMVDPRGGAFTLGLGLLANLAVIPEFDLWSEDADPPHPQAQPGRPGARRHPAGHRAAPRPGRLVARRRRRRR